MLIWCLVEMVGYVDSDYVGELNCRECIIGPVFTLTRRAISWRSILQFVVALSTTKAEYIAMTKVAK